MIKRLFRFSESLLLKEDTLKPHLAHSGDVGKLSHLLLDRVWHDHDDLLGFEEVVGEEW